MAGERMHTLYPTPLDPPLALATKTVKKSGIFQSLGTINFVLFYKKTESINKLFYKNTESMDTLLTALHLFRAVA